MNRSLLLVALAALLAGACADAAPDDPAGPGPAPAGFGTVTLGLTSTAPLTGTFTADLVIKRSSDGAEAFADAFGLPPSTKVLKQVHLKQGTYDVLLDLLDADGQPAWSGSVEDVGVVAGALTSVQIPMQAAGGVHIAVDLAARGALFEPSFAASGSGPAYLWWAGTQRTRPGAAPGAVVTEYLGLAGYDYNAFNRAAHLFVAASPEDLLTAEPATELNPFTYNVTCLEEKAGVTLASSGDHLYAACVRNGKVRVERFDDAFDGLTAIEVGLVRQKTSFGLFDEVGGCSLLVDDQLNLFCMVREPVDAAGSTRHGMVHAWSADGLTWSPLLPYGDPPAAGAKASPDFVALLVANGVSVMPPSLSGIGFPALHVMQGGGIYRAYAYSSGWASAQVTLSASVDRASWSPISLDYRATALTVQLAKMRGLAVYADPAGWALVYVDGDGKRRLATEVQ